MSGLLAWLDARANNARFVLRLEDIDPNRAKVEWADALRRDLAWFGLDWDEVVIQTARSHEHWSALDRLAKADLLYGCTCTRGELKRTAELAADGSRKYPGTCRERRLSDRQWREFSGAVRVHLPPGAVKMRGLTGGSQIFNPLAEMGDPIIRRKDGAVAYHLAVVVDDIAAGVTRVIRGHDLLFATGVHLALYDALGAPAPAYFHHLLLFEPRNGSQKRQQKLAKLHGSVGAAELRERFTPEELCGVLAHAAGIHPSRKPITPRELVANFRLDAISQRDQVVTWDGNTLETAPCP
jgi:glutamyl/glutaminyl-tRNA synthetase